MARVRFRAMLVTDARTGLPRLDLAGLTGQIVIAGTTTPTPITDNDGLPVTSSSITISSSGFTPTFWSEDGLTEVDWLAAGAIRVPIDSTQGLEESAAASATASQASQAAAEAAQAAAGGDVTAAVQQYLVAHPPAAAPADWSTIANKPDLAPAVHTHTTAAITDMTAVGKASALAVDKQAGRAAIDAAPSSTVSWPGNGTTAGTTAAGNHGHLAQNIQFAPTGSITATDVQAAIAQAALTGGGGGGTSTTLDVFYASGAYPSSAASPPAGTKVRHFYGPVQYAGATIAGILDLQTYAALT